MKKEENSIKRSITQGGQSLRSFFFIFLSSSSSSLLTHPPFLPLFSLYFSRFVFLFLFTTISRLLRLSSCNLSPPLSLSSRFEDDQIRIGLRRPPQHRHNQHNDLARSADEHSGALFQSLRSCRQQRLFPGGRVVRVFLRIVPMPTLRLFRSTPVPALNLLFDFVPSHLSFYSVA